MGLSFSEKRELEEAEKLIDDIGTDSKHPANDPKHPDHKRFSRALNQLIQIVDQTRARLEAEGRFK